MKRILEPEVMDTREEAEAYDTMDHSSVNRLFVDDLLELLHDDGGAASATLRRPVSKYVKPLSLQG